MNVVDAIIALLRDRAKQKLDQALSVDSDSLTKVQATSEHTALVTAADAIAERFSTASPVVDAAMKKDAHHG